MLEYGDKLADSGLVVESFGPGAVIVREAPALLGQCDLQSLVRDLAHELARERNRQCGGAAQRDLRHHGVPRQRARGPGHAPGRDERAAPRDGSDAQRRAMQSRPPHLCRAFARRAGAAFRAAIGREACPSPSVVLVALLKNSNLPPLSALLGCGSLNRPGCKG